MRRGFGLPRLEEEHFAVMALGKLYRRPSEARGFLGQSLLESCGVFDTAAMLEHCALLSLGARRDRNARSHHR
jgi:hypothetical protein